MEHQSNTTEQTPPADPSPAARLQSLEQRNQDLEESVRLLTAYQSIGQAAISSLEPEKVLDSVAQHVVQAGVFRSLMIALVDHDAERVEVVRNYLSVAEGAEGTALPTDEKLQPGGTLTPKPVVGRTVHPQRADYRHGVLPP